MDLNQRRWQLAFNGIKLDGTTNSIATGTQISRDNKRMIFGYWDTAVGRSFWKHDPNTSWNNTWSPFSKSIFTAATGAISRLGRDAFADGTALRDRQRSEPARSAAARPRPASLPRRLSER